MQQSVYNGLYLPQRYSDRNGAVQRGKFLAPVTVGSDRNIVTAVAGKCIWVPWLQVFNSSTTVTATLFLKTASGFNFGCIVPPTAVVNPNAFFPFNESGYLDTLVGEAILADVGGADVLLTLPWYAYTP